MSERATETSEEILAEDEEGSPDLGTLLERFARNLSDDIHVASPGMASSVDRSTGSCAVQATVRRAGSAGEPVVPDAMVLQLRSGTAVVHIPVSAGPVTVIYADRSLDEWSRGDGDKENVAEDPRSHDVGDAMVMPFSAGAAPEGHENDLVVAYGDAQIVITSSGDVVVTPAAGRSVRLGSSSSSDAAVAASSATQAAIAALAPGAIEPALAPVVAALKALTFSTLVKVS